MNPIIHPVRTALGQGQQLLAGGASGSAMGVPAMAATGNPTIDAQNQEAVSGARDNAADQGREMAIHPANTAGQLTGGYLLSKGLAAIPGMAAAAPEAATDAAAGIWNKTIGARGMTGRGDFARNANPGRGAVDAGIGPSGSMQSIADKAAAARQEVGQALGDAYQQADTKGTLIPAEDVRKAVGDILNDAKQKASAPGVVADPAIYDQIADSFRPALRAAWDKGGFTPSELWKIRKDMNESLNWGDQSKLNVTKVQQRISGALGGVLEKAVPEVEDLNQNYQDLTKLHGRASERAATGSSPLTGIAGKVAAMGAGALAGSHSPIGAAAGAVFGGALDSVPVKTTLASGLGAAGKVLRPAGEAVQSLVPVARNVSSAVPLAAIAGNSQPSTPGDTQNDKDADTGPKEVDQNVQEAPSAESITPAATPDTHSFSTSEWIKSNPDGDPNEAKGEAAKQGYTVTD